MNSKIKALFAVAIMVAAAFMIVVPMDKDDGSDAAAWNGEMSKVTFVGNSYEFSYKVVLPLKDAMFTVESDEITIVASVSAVDERYASGTTISATINAVDLGADKEATIILKSFYEIGLGYQAPSGVNSKSIVFESVAIGSYFVDSNADSNVTIESSGVVGAEYDYKVGNNANATYSAVGLPAGLTMMKDGTIYGAPQEEVDEKAVTLYAYDSSKGYVQSYKFKFTAATVDSLIVAKEVTPAHLEVEESVVDLGAYIYSDKDVRFTLADGYTFKDNNDDEKSVTYTVEQVVGDPISADNKQMYINLDNMRGEVTVLFSINVSGSVFQVSKTFFVMPLSEFLTDPNADMQIEPAAAPVEP